MRILMKVSGEALKNGNNISSNMLEILIKDVKKLKKAGHEIIIVVGGGNFWRGRNDLDISSVVSDHVGMLATVMNAISINDYFNNNNLMSSCYSAFACDGIVKKYHYQDVIGKLNQNEVIILGGGTGVPNFSTDMITIEKALELNADFILMAKNIDGIYDKDPKIDAAKKLKEITHEELFLNQIKQGVGSLGVIDFEAMASLVKCKIPLYIYDAKDEKGIDNFINNKPTGTFVITRL